MANFNIDYLVVAGGGGGGPGFQAGGGGGGGLRTSYGTSSGGGSSNESQLTLSASASYTVTVGNGGAGGAAISADSAEKGDNGNNSIFHTITSLGGGGGASYYNVPSSGLAGGSGGGAGNRYANPNQSGGAGTTNQGYAGGNTTTYLSPYSGGGGGGAASAGANGGASNALGNGGDGLEVNIVGGTGNYYAGGGGAGVYSSGSIPTGGSGGGGTGSRGGFSNATSPGVGLNGLGGGGGGGGSSNVAGGDGGDGIVILRYATADVTSYTVTGAAPTETTDGTDTILSFTTVGTGSITFTTPIPPFSGSKVTTPVTDFDKPLTEEGLKIPSGTSSEQPTGVEGMVRNDTTQSSRGSSSAISYYNGTNWRYFENELNTSFNTVIYTGSTSPHAITGVGFSPDLIWIKNRDQPDSSAIVDSVRGITSPAPYIASDRTDAQFTSTNMPTSVQSDGFTITGNGGRTNTSGEDYVAWCWKAELANKAADFNGSNSYTYASSSVQQPTTNFSVSVWSKWDSKPSGTVGLVGNFRTGGGGTQPGLAIAKFSGTNVFRFYTGQNDYVSGTTNFSTNTWYHVVGTYDGSNIKIYVNGVLEGTQPYTGTPLTTTEPLVIGRMYGNYSGYYHNGLINQVRLFNSAVSASQVTELYNETATDNSVLNFPNGAGCVAAYNLGENANGVDGLYNTTASNVTFGKPGYLTQNTEGTITSTVSANNDLGFSIVKYTGNLTGATTGTITSTVSANNDLGFSIVKYTGNLTGATTATGQSVGHGMDVPPELIIFKSTSNSTSWDVFSSELDNWSTRLQLNSSGQKNNLYSQYPIANPTSSVFYTNYLSAVNVNNYDYIAYCFASKPNYSKVGAYTGDGTTSHSITTGFEPAFIIIKRTDDISNWRIFDNVRGTQKELYANSSAAEPSDVSYINFDSNGFTLTSNGGWINNSGGEFIYLAFANTI